MADDDYLTRKAAAAYLAKLGCPVAPKTLENLAANDNAGRGPSFTRAMTRIVRYRRADLDAWAARNMKRVE